MGHALLRWQPVGVGRGCPARVALPTAAAVRILGCGGGDHCRAASAAASAVAAAAAAAAVAAAAAAASVAAAAAAATVAATTTLATVADAVVVTDAALSDGVGVVLVERRQLVATAVRQRRRAIGTTVCRATTVGRPRWGKGSPRRAAAAIAAAVAADIAAAVAAAVVSSDAVKMVEVGTALVQRRQLAATRVGGGRWAVRTAV